MILGLPRHECLYCFTTYLVARNASLEKTSVEDDNRIAELEQTKGRIHEDRIAALEMTRMAH